MTNRDASPIESLRLASVQPQSALFQTRSGGVGVACSMDGREDFPAFVALFAAAPDLLAACREFVRKVDAGEARSIRSYAQMKAAIAKAEG